MPRVAVGNHAKLNARAVDRARIRKFYHDVLGCEITKRSDTMDYFRFDADFFVAVIYDNLAPSEQEQVKSIWLEPVDTINDGAKCPTRQRLVLDDKDSNARRSANRRHD